MHVYLPPELEPFEGDLRFFFDLMIRKLHMNRHKGFGENSNMQSLLAGLQREHYELLEAAMNESQFECALEAADVANFAFLIATRLFRQHVADFKDEQMELAELRTPEPARRPEYGSASVHPDKNELVAKMVPGAKFGGST